MGLDECLDYYRTLITELQSQGAKASSARFQANLIESKDGNFALYDSRDRAAYYTYLDSLHQPGVLRLLYQLKRGLKPFRGSEIAAGFTIKSGESNLRHGLTILFRPQKIIVLDRINGLTVIAMRDESSLGLEKLKNEAAVTEILPDLTLPILYRQFNCSPHFAIQEYCSFVACSAHTISAGMLAKALHGLFRYYDFHGISIVDSHSYVVTLFEQIERAIEGGSLAVNQDRLSKIIHHIQRSLELMTGAVELALTKVHGDFIESHIVRPRRGEKTKSLLLLDWAESTRYSIFFDMFYFKFQNHSTDIWNHFPSIGSADCLRHYGDGWITFCNLLKERNLRIDDDFIRMSFAICFLEALHQRLTRLPECFLPFWITQAEKACAAGDV